LLQYGGTTRDALVVAAQRTSAQCTVGGLHKASSGGAYANSHPILVLLSAAFSLSLSFSLYYFLVRPCTYSHRDLARCTRFWLCRPIPFSLPSAAPRSTPSPSRRVVYFPYYTPWPLHLRFLHHHHHHHHHLRVLSHESSRPSSSIYLSSRIGSRVVRTSVMHTLT